MVIFTRIIHKNLLFITHYPAPKANLDRNPGAATIIRVEPLPEGTTDIDLLEAGWQFVDQGKIIIYGAIKEMP